MSGIATVYVAFAIVIVAVLGYLLLMSRREREIEMEYEDLMERHSRSR